MLALAGHVGIQILSISGLHAGPSRIAAGGKDNCGYKDQLRPLFTRFKVASARGIPLSSRKLSSCKQKPMHSRRKKEMVFFPTTAKGGTKK